MPLGIIILYGTLYLPEPALVMILSRGGLGLLCASPLSPWAFAVGLSFWVVAGGAEVGCL